MSAQPLAQQIALVYCRVSTKGQEENGTSLDSQEREGIAHAQALGFTVGRITKEVYSGAELWDRPKLNADRADLKAGRFAALICYATDCRVTRSIWRSWPRSASAPAWRCISSPRRLMIPTNRR